MSEIINLLLEISKTDTGNSIPKMLIRVDELIFDNTDELSLLHPDFTFSIEYADLVDDESKLTILGSIPLLKAAFMNLMVNSVHYSENKEAKIGISSHPDYLQIDFINKGPIISKEEEKYLFQHFFRGDNSKGKSGFGLGLVFVYKIILQHGGSIAYTTDNLDQNIFTIHLPLR